MKELKARDRLIVALDVPTAEDAMALVEKLDPVVTFYKIGWQLFMAGGLETLLRALRDKKIFLDLKVPGDIGNTVRSAVEVCVSMGVRFLTLSDNMPPSSLRAAREARGNGKLPELLMVPFLSSLDATDLEAMKGRKDLDAYFLERAEAAVSAGIDGLIASGDAIRVLRERYGGSIRIVSPGIRPEGSSVDDHKRSTTPTEAIAMGADYLVVGRPIRNAADPLDAARGVIDEIDAALISAIGPPSTRP